MDLTSTDILFGLGAVAAAVIAASAVYWISGRVSRPAPPGPIPVSPAPAGPAAPAPPAAPQPRTGSGTDPHGRHRAPDELLRASTYRLSADRIARARVRVPDEDAQSQAVPSPSRSSS